MKLLLKVGRAILSLSLIFAPVTVQAKQKTAHKHKVSHHHTKRQLNSSGKHKVSYHHTKGQLNSSGKHKKHHKIYSKRSIVKVSYSYGPRVYAAENIQPNTEIYRYAVGLLGTKYRFGGESINGIDCSSFVQNVFELAGYKMPRTAREQARYGYFVRKEDLKPGDLLFFATYANFPSHVGIYIGDGKMIHASSRGNKVEVASIYQDYYQRRFLFAKRIPANLKDLEDIKDIESFMDENLKDYIMSIESQKEVRKETLKSKRESDPDPIARLIKEKNAN